jgi:hypothetical protein
VEAVAVRPSVGENIRHALEQPTIDRGLVLLE